MGKLNIEYSKNAVCDKQKMKARPGIEMGKGRKPGRGPVRVNYMKKQR